ncbi:MAG: hypothetical protein ACFCD0_19840 [Gemmataceae bacterium]
MLVSDDVPDVNGVKLGAKVRLKPMAAGGGKLAIARTLECTRPRSPLTIVQPSLTDRNGFTARVVLYAFAPQKKSGEGWSLAVPS